MRFTLPTVALVAVACMPRQSFEAEAGCDEAIHSPVWEDRRDVSGSKTGVRCKGSGCAPQPPANDIDELEMHFSNSPLYHWIDGNAYGNCIVFPNGDYNCPLAGLRIEGRRKFRCLTKYTANDLRANTRLPDVSTTLLDFVEANIKRDLTAGPFTG
ncbi:hypothetical protein LX32DRAFT_690331 [Colletotrichum zoysiae]|uniref:Uncharacterized protein n=1 Tax=Colletotrichum zoysiae TaxID=1216348 RepID=A0AAD9HRW0_9PEZI|nr:hypothetical protein LX32DRAFT_690331 [Colletotrichum zoysiae]